MADATTSIGTISDDAVRRRQKLLDGLQSIRMSGVVQRLWSENTLFVIGGVMAPLGLILIVLGWLGAANTPFLFEQVPYLISGGLFGLGLTVLGGLFYFAHWVTELAKEQRDQTDALVQAITELRDTLAESADSAEPAAAPKRTSKRSAKKG